STLFRSTNENKDFKLMVSTGGDVVPENVKISFNNESYVLQQISPGNFEYVFSKPKSDIKFELSSIGVRSKSYVLNVVEVPSLLKFEMHLDYPSYTRRMDEI